MDRWKWFGLIFCISAVGLHAQARPNILWVVSEDNSPLLGAYGDDYATTPHLDTMAADGVRYTHAFATSPVCAPARFTLATGVYPNRAGTEHMRSQNAIPAHIRFLSSYLREAGYYCTNNEKEDYNIARKPADAWDESSDKATYRNRSPGQPFFHVQNITTSHESCLHRRTRPEFHDPAAVSLPPYHPDLPAVRETWAVYYDYVTRMDQEVGQWLAQLEADGLAEDTIVFYYSDHGGALARSKRFLYESGMRVPLIVRFPAKWQHLAPALPGAAMDRLVTFVDLPPTVLSLAGVPIPEHMQGQAFLGAAAAEPREYAYGLRGRMDGKADRARTVRDERFRYIRNWMPFRPWGQYLEYLWRAPATKAWHQAYLAGETNAVQSRFFTAPKPREELYDCLADPYNVHNLAGDPQYETTLIRLRKTLDHWVRDNHDSGLLPEAEMIAKAKARGETIYEMVGAPDFPLEDLLAAANRAADPQTPQERLWEDMQAELAGVRYWATAAWLLHGEDNAKVRQQLIARLDDSSMSVALIAAEALYRRGVSDERIVQVYRKGLEHTERMVRVAAASSLGQTEPSFIRQFQESIEARLTQKAKWEPDYRAFSSLTKRLDEAF